VATQRAEVTQRFGFFGVLIAKGKLARCLSASVLYSPRGGPLIPIMIIPGTTGRKESAMKTSVFGFAMLLLLGASPLASAQYTGKPLKLVLDRRSTVDPVGIVKNLVQKCPNITLTTNARESDYMLAAWGWSGNYRFMVIAKGGDTIFATQTSFLSNAVKDVCKFLNSHTQQPY